MPEDPREDRKTKIENEVFPPGFTRLYTLRGHKDVINRVVWSPDMQVLASMSRDKIIGIWSIATGQLRRKLKTDASILTMAWSPDGRLLAIGCDDGTIKLWNVSTWQLYQQLKVHSDLVVSVIWSPDGKMLAFSFDDNIIRFWDIEKRRQLNQQLKGHSDWINSMVWSADGRELVSCSWDQTIRLWDVVTGQLRWSPKRHPSGVLGVAWSPDGQTLVSSTRDGTIWLWDSKTGRQKGILEGHTGTVGCVSFSSEGGLLASKSKDGTVRLWRTDRWELVSILDEPGASSIYMTSVSFHPQLPILATLGERDEVIRVWKLDFDILLGISGSTFPVHYSNAKIVLVGDTGVGKSGLALALTDQPFIPTESTHGRHVYIFESQKIELDGERQITHEILLWDLAGQPGYRLIHQLHLNEVAVALVVFDARSETDPFAGARHWDRALRQAQRIQGETALPLKKFFVAARVDRGGIGVSQARIEALVRNWGFDGYFATSAKERWQIKELAEAIRKAINWEVLPIVSSTELFEQIKEFLITEKKSARLLSTVDDLYRVFLQTKDTSSETEELRAQFETCIGRVESRGLIRRLNFGGLILLQPELLDAYASAMVNAAKDEPDGLGSLNEEDARIGRFYIPEGERLPDKNQERLLLMATVEDLLRHDIALRESTDEGPLLVFPSQFTREGSGASGPEGKAVIFNFEGSVLNIYATLAVRLSRSGLFKKKQMWKNAATYIATDGGTCGILLRELEEGQGELTLFFDQIATEQIRFQFEIYIQAHLQRRALAESVQRRQIFVCSGCKFVLSEQLVQLRTKRGLDWLRCPVCDTYISLFDRPERLEKVSATIPEMDRAANVQRDRDAATFILQGKTATGDFDVFLCHSSADKPAVKEIGEKLKERGILPWLDEWELRPGLPWQRLLEQQIGQIKSAAVFVGRAGIGPWQQQELEAFLREFVNRGCPVIPVLLPKAQKQPSLPIFLKGMTWVDFRKQEPDPLKQLLWGITGERERVV